MAHLKKLSAKAYISKRIKDAFGTIDEERYNFICAPTGYGKSYICRTIFKNCSDNTILRIDANTSKTIFWSNVCDVFKLADPKLATKLLGMGFPDTEETVNNVIKLISSSKETDTKRIIVIDNFDNIFDNNTAKIIEALASSRALGFSYIFIVRNIQYHSIIRAIKKHEINCIDRDILSLNSDEIYEFYQKSEMHITKHFADELYKMTDGWPYIVELFVDKYENDDFSKAYEAGYDFIESSIWYYLDDEIRDFLLKLCVFQEFSINQCTTQTGLSERKCLNLLRQISLIYFDSERRVYRLNTFFRSYVLKNLMLRTAEEIDSIRLSAADTCLSHNDIFYAIYLYAGSRCFDKIYRCNADFKDIYGHINKNNRAMFLSIANEYWSVDKGGCYKFSIILCFAMIIYNERAIAQNLLKDLYLDIVSDNLVSDSGKKQLLAELKYIEAFMEYNDFKKMDEFFRSIPSVTQMPLGLIAGQFPFNFECPSMICLYHRKVGNLDIENMLIEESAPNYYRITNGHAKGYEALMKADVLYHRGDINSAEILCHKAAYMSYSRNQFSINIAANYMLAKISIFNGNKEAYKGYINNIDSTADSDALISANLKRMADISKSMIYAELEENDKITGWMKNEKTIENNMSIFLLNFANIALGRYLINTGDYNHFLGISGQFIGATKVYSQIVPRIYVYIYLSIANYREGDINKSHKFLLEALELAVHDNLIMPFVENYQQLEVAFKEISTNKNISAFIKNITKLSVKYLKGVNTIKKADRISAEYGLTVREADVARLAAKRLSNKEIAKQLFIAESTVKSNLKVIFNKLQISSRNELSDYFE